ncbi:hypothetical protein BC835DRAFT_1422137 [Cytidiella melzeri]|nr:hypothetical protein BC835DRAFT_1422137 [Cytidiella melzeri]
MPPPGRRREWRLYDAGASSRQQSPLATAPLCMASGIRDRFSSKGKAHNPSSSDSSVNLPSVSEIIEDLYRKREQNLAQNMQKAPAIPRNHSKCHHLTNPIDVIELTDSDGSLPARPRPSFPTNSDREIIEIDDNDNEPVISTQRKPRGAHQLQHLLNREGPILRNGPPYNQFGQALPLLIFYELSNHPVSPAILLQVPPTSAPQRSSQGSTDFYGNSSFISLDPTPASETPQQQRPPSPGGRSIFEFISPFDALSNPPATQQQKRKPVPTQPSSAPSTSDQVSL